MENIYEVISGEISKEKYRSKHIFLRNEELIATYKINCKAKQTMKIKEDSLPN